MMRLLQDIGFAWSKLRGRFDPTRHGVRGVEDLRRLLSLEAAKISDGDFHLFQTESDKRLLDVDGVDIGGGMRLSVPLRDSELREWSSVLGNCLHGYGKKFSRVSAKFLESLDPRAFASPLRLEGKKLFSLRGRERPRRRLQPGRLLKRFCFVGD